MSVEPPLIRDILNGSLNSRIEGSQFGAAFPATQLTTQELAGGVTPVNYGFTPENIKRDGAKATNTNAANKIALDTRVTVNGLAVVDADISYGYVITDDTTHPNIRSSLTPKIVIDYGPGNSYSTYPNPYEGAQIRNFFYTPSPYVTLTFTTPPLAGATSGTLTANWTGDTAIYRMSFSNGDVHAVTLTSGATTATWPNPLAGGATATVTVLTYFHDGNGERWISDWHPYLWVDNFGGPQGPRTDDDNRRCSLFFGCDGVASWQFFQGTIASATATDEELSNLGIIKWSKPGDTLGTYYPLIIDRKTGNWSIGTGSNTPGASYHFKSISTGFINMMIESLTTLSRLMLRNSDGSADDVELRNNDGNIDLFIASQGTALTVVKATRDVLIGTGTDDTSAKLNVASTTQGFLPPRMTTVQRDAISSPAAGLLIYNTSTGKLNVRGAAAWEAVTSV